MQTTIRRLAAFCLALCAIVVPALPAAVRADDLPALEFRQSGGFAGRTYEVQLWENGQQRRTIGTGGNQPAMVDHVPAETVRELVNDLVTVGFLDMPDRYGPENACCDRFEYTIVLRTAGREKTLTVVDGADAPDVLWQQIRILRGFLPMGQA